MLKVYPLPDPKVNREVDNGVDGKMPKNLRISPTDCV